MVRLKQLIRFSKGAGAQAFFLVNDEESGQPNTEYLTGFKGTTSQTFITARGEVYLYLDGRYSERAGGEVMKGVRIVPVTHEKPLEASLRALLKRLKIRKILFDSTITTVASHTRLKKMLPGVTFVAQPHLMHEVRMVKDAGEIRAITCACRITMRAFRDIAKHLRAGVSEIELATLLEERFYHHGATGVAFPSIVAAGVHGSEPHAVAGSKKLRAGEYVTIDCGALYKGYASDFTRTVLVPGRAPSLHMKKMYDAVHQAQEAGIACVRPGVRASEIDTACRSFLVREGLAEYFVHGTGHGVGRQVHELPIIGPRSSTVLKPGMILTVEPGVYIPGVGGVRIEDTLLVTKNGAQILTR